MSTAPGNEGQAAFWSESGGQAWVRFQEQMDRQLEPLGAAGLAALAAQPGEAVLDVGCGCGATSLVLAASVGPTGRVVGVDISTSMTALAGERLAAAGYASSKALVSDAQTAAVDHIGGPVDAVFSRFGVMFFSDPVAAFKNIRALTKPGGRMVFVCWQAASLNRWASELGRALTAMFPPDSPPDPYAPGPFAFADETRTNDLLAQAGWSEISAESCVLPVQLFGTSDFELALQGSLSIGGAGRMLANADAETAAKIHATARQVLQSQWGPKGAIMDGAVWIISARNK